MSVKYVYSAKSRRQKRKGEIRLSDERMCRGIEFQLLGEDTQKARETKDDLIQEGIARR